MMQFLRGDVTHCAAAVDGFYFMFIRSKEYRLAISNYTLKIPLEGKYAAAENKMQVPEETILKLIQNHPGYCHDSQDVLRFPYNIQNGMVVVRPILEGQVLRLTKSYEILNRNYEVAYHRKYHNKICYPSNITVDYIDIQPYDIQGGLH